MKTDPIPQQPNDNPAIPEYFNTIHDSSSASYIQNSADRYTAMTDEQKAEDAEQASQSIRERFAESGLTSDRIDEILEGMRTNTDFSQSDLERQAGIDPDEIDEKEFTVRGYALRPSELLSRAFESHEVRCAEEFEALAPDAQWQYQLSLRAKIMRLHQSSSSYDAVSYYGVLPSDVVEQEAELYTAIVDSQTDNITKTEVFAQARRSPRLMPDNDSLDGPMLPGDVRFATSGNESLSQQIHNRMPQIEVEYLQAAADQLRAAQSAI